MKDKYKEDSSSAHHQIDGCNDGGNTETSSRVSDAQLEAAERFMSDENEIYRDNTGAQEIEDPETDNYELIEEGFDLFTHGGGSIETVQGFNLARPMVESIGPNTEEPLPEQWTTMRDAAIAHYEKDFDAESICGTDNRVRVNAVTSPPFRMIAKLVITAQDGNRYGGTGWFISPRTVITAGHCLYSNRTGGWARSIEVIPGMDSRYRPFGSATATVFKSVTGWTRENDPAQDYGCIILPESSPLGEQVGYFGFAALKEEKLENLLVNTSGYPGDKSFGTQWFNAGRISTVLPNRLEYMIDTFRGHSGSNVWRYEKTTGSRVAVGIHNYGGCENKASRINTQLFELMQKWKADGM